ncbi:hypothetical protein ACFU5E_12465 [Aeromonas bestiarum]|uniref:hypothetical protein n=1 Tax=Aeromonas bestiarum TaxID=105751 RepID=UPI00366E8FE5
MVMRMAVVMRMLVVMSMTMVMRVGMIMMMVVMVLMTLFSHWRPYPVVVVMDIPLMVIVVVNDQGARCALLVGMMVLSLMGMMVAVLMVMVVLMIVSVGVFMVVILFMAGDPRLATSAYATHINLPRYR